MSIKSLGKDAQPHKPSGKFESKLQRGTSLVVQWLRLHASTAGGTGSIPVQGTKIQHTEQCSQK